MSAAWRILSVLALLLVACGPATPLASEAPSTTADADPTAMPAATATVAPTATDQPTITSTSEPPPTAEPTVTSTPEPSTTAEPLQLQLAFIDESGFLQLAEPGGRLTPIWNRSVVDGSAWAPDGSRLAFITDGVLYLWDAASGAATTLLEQPASAGTPSWSADGTQLAVTTPAEPGRECSVDAPCDITLVAADGAAARTLGPGAAPSFAPAGTALLAASLEPQAPQNREADWALPLLWPSPADQPITVAEGAGAADRTRAAWSADGTLVAVNNVVLAADGTIVEQLDPPADALAGAGSTTVANGLAPGGETVALATLVVTRTDVGFINATTLSLLDRGSAQRTTIWQNQPTAPELEPPAAAPAQNRRVDLRRTGHSRYWRVSPVAWSRDGTQLAFTGCGVALATPEEQGCGLWIAAGDGTDLRLVPETAGAEGVEDSRQGARFAPDGSRLAFLRLRRGDQPGFEIWTWATDGSAAPERIGRGTAPVWQP